MKWVHFDQNRSSLIILEFRKIGPIIEVLTKGKFTVEYIINFEGDLEPAAKDSKRKWYVASISQ